jgi:hypothetical protein
VDKSVYNKSRVLKVPLLADVQIKPRRWTVIASGLLCGVLAVVVLFTNPHAFFSPLAVVVVGAIGLAAVLLQLRLFGRERAGSVHAPVWLNFLGILLSLAALFSDRLRFNSALTEALALGAVTTFGVSGAIILHAVRKQRTAAK